ncbi:MAG: AMP-binding protein [Alphaproteobacteria bacterium]|nr:AMP-binding protein [Alphaproteobacteria bacterium]
MQDWFPKGTVGDLPASAARRFGEREALVFEGRRWSHAAFSAEVDRVARGLMALGVAPGEHVATWLTNRPEHLFLIYAIARIGGVVVPLNTRYRSHDAGFTIRHSNSATLVLLERSGPVNYLAMARELLPELDHDTSTFAAFSDLKRVIVLGAGVPPGAIAWSELLEKAGYVTHGDLETRAAAVDPDGVFLIAYTSGTTGDPKGVMHTHRCLRTLTDHANRLGLTEADTVMTYLPVFHLYGLSDCVLVSALAGARQVLVDAFDPDECLRLAEAERATILHGFDTFYRDLMLAQERHPRDISSLRLGTLAVGMESSLPIAEAAQRTLCPTVSGWGLTESWAFATMSFPGSSEEQRCAASGYPMAGYEIRIVDPATGGDQLTGVPGEILVRGYMITPGYYRQPEATRAVIDEAGWLHTGDMGVLRADGHLRFLGRYKDVLKVGGENVSPAEIEAFLMGHAAVAQVAVIGIPDERLGEVAVAFVVPKASVPQANENELIAHCKGRIASFKLPRHVFYVEALPMTPTGKVQKFRLREDARARLDKVRPK